MVDDRDEIARDLARMESVHREFADALGALAKAADEDLIQPLGDLLQHTIAHFRQENQWMRESGYPGAAPHVAAHDNVLKVMAAVLRCVVDGDYRIGRMLIRELRRWQHAHVEEMDKPLERFLRGATEGPGGAVSPAGPRARRTRREPATRKR